MIGPNGDYGAVKFERLFDGRKDAVGLGRGGVEHRTVTTRMYADHLRGLVGHDIGIFPVRDDNTVMFAALDLDEQNEDLAKKLALLMPGAAWVERSRSKGYHVWVFFAAPCPAWAAKKVLQNTCYTAGRMDIEVFPKQDELREGMVGNYINLPLFGEERPLVWVDYIGSAAATFDLNASSFELAEGGLDYFLSEAPKHLIDPDNWIGRARGFGGVAPEDRGEASVWGDRSQPHRCALYILEHKDDNPLMPGARSAVLFNVAKQFLNCSEYDEAETREMVEAINQAGPRPLPSREVARFVRNASRGHWTSTGCDDPLFVDYADPKCPIAHG